MTESQARFLQDSVLKLQCREYRGTRNNCQQRSVNTYLQILQIGPELKQENRGETNHRLSGGCFAWHSKVETKQETSFEFTFHFTWNTRGGRWECVCFQSLTETSKFATLCPNFPRLPKSHPQTQAIIYISAHDPRLHRAVFYFSNYAVSKWAFSWIPTVFCCFGSLYSLYTHKQPPPRELRMRNANPRPADEAVETGLGASVFRFSKHETPREIRWSVSRNETPAKIVFRFCCFITRYKSCFVSVVHTSS